MECHLLHSMSKPIWFRTRILQMGEFEKESKNAFMSMAELRKNCQNMQWFSVICKLNDKKLVSSITFHNNIIIIEQYLLFRNFIASSSDLFSFIKWSAEKITYIHTRLALTHFVILSNFLLSLCCLKQDFQHRQNFYLPASIYKA